MADTGQLRVRSTRLDHTRRRVERWRETRRHRHVSMPAALWDAAVARGTSARALPHRTDTARGLALKKHLEATPDSAQALPATPFVELAIYVQKQAPA